jgi:hypothetical protein
MARAQRDALGSLQDLEQELRSASAAHVQLYPTRQSCPMERLKPSTQRLVVAVVAFVRRMIAPALALAFLAALRVAAVMYRPATVYPGQ